MPCYDSRTIPSVLLSLFLCSGGLGCLDDEPDDDDTSEPGDDDTQGDDDTGDDDTGDDDTGDDDTGDDDTGDDDTDAGDQDGDGSPTGVDCDDQDPNNYPGNLEVCDGQDNNCDSNSDEGVITDGAGCLDPGMPSFPTTIGDLTITVRTGDTPESGTDDGPVRFCLSSDDCWNLNNDNWNDFERDTVDVFTLAGVGVPRADVDWVQFQFSENDDWKIACIEVAFDGEQVYCNEINQWMGTNSTSDTLWSDTSLTSSCSSCYASALSHGPMVGAVENDLARVWVRSTSTRPTSLRVSTTPAGLSGAAPVAYAYPESSSDMTHVFEVQGLSAQTTYHYAVDVDGAQQSGGSFRTAPAPASPTQLRFGFGSCSKFDSQPIFDQIALEDPDAFFFVGDNHYGNTNELSDLRRYYKWGLEIENRADLLTDTITLATWDDHDFVGNNTDGTAPGKDNALQAFTEYWANPSYGTQATDGVFSSWSYGDLEFWLLDDRFWRAIDSNILGNAQTAWLQGELLASTATFKFIINGSQWTTEGTSDSWGAYPEAQVALMNWIVDNDIEGVVLMSGDVHFSEMRLLPGGQLGYSLPELTSSPLANNLSSTEESNEQVVYFDSAPSYMMVEVDTTFADPTITATLYDESGGFLSDWQIFHSELVVPTTYPVDPKEDPDFDGDGYADLAVGMPYEDIGFDSNSGAVFVIPGSSIGGRSLGSAMWHSDNTGAVPADAVEAHDQLGAAVAYGDFNNDGFSDLAVGIPGEDIGNDGETGMVTVIYGAPGGLDPASTENWHQDTANVAGTGEDDDTCGVALAVGDFDGNGFDDLVIGCPGEAIGSDAEAGSIITLHGTSTGLSATTAPGSQFFSQDHLAGTTPEPGDYCGAVLAAGDYNGDGFDDIAVGCPNEAIGSVSGAGLVGVIYGSAAGLYDDIAGPPITHTIHQGQSGIVGNAESNDHFGQALAAGDFDGDGVDDLAIGVPDEEIASNTLSSGGVVIIEGVAGSGLEEASSPLTMLTMNGLSMAANNDGFGSALRAADLNGDGLDDLVVGAPGRNSARGGVMLIWGSATPNIAETATMQWIEPTAIPGYSVGSSNQDFGGALSTGDFDADGWTDLLIGIPELNVNGVTDAGGVLLLRGSANGPQTGSAQLWHGDLHSLAGAAESGDRLGFALP